MRRFILSTILVMAIICNLIFIPSMAFATTMINVPPDWQLIGSEDFNSAASDTLATEYVSSCSPSLITGLWSDESTYTGTPATIKSDTGELIIYGKGNRGSTLKGALTSPIDLSVDADYYIMVDGTFPEWNYTGISVGLGYNDTVAGKYKSYYFGTYKNNSPQYPTISPSNTNDTTYKSLNDRAHNWGTLQTMLVQISARSSKMDMVRMRFFDNEAEELPSITPEFWDVQHQADLTGVAQFEDFWIKGSNNAGNENSAIIDNIYLYKAAPMNGYITTGTAYDSRPKYSVGDVVAPPLRIPTTIPDTTEDLVSTVTFDDVPAQNAAGQNQTVISKGWYNYSVDPPQLLTDSNSYNVDISMAEKLLKAVIVVEANGVQTTYEPYTGYVRAGYDYLSLNATLYGNKKYDPTTATVDNWATATKIDFTAKFSKNINSKTFSGTAALIVAQYSSDGMLKQVQTVPYTKKLGFMVTGSPQNVTVSIPITQEPANYELGDYFKAYAWRSDVDVSGEFGFDILIPLSYNKNCVNKIQRVDIPLN